MHKETQHHVYMISDASGETVRTVVNACLSQFSTARIEKHIFSLIRMDTQMQEVINEIKLKAKTESVIVLYSLVNQTLREMLCVELEKENIFLVSVLREVIESFKTFFKMEPDNKPGIQYLMDESYFDRIDAMQYALIHDDGQAAWDLEDADVILVGVSRTSKTPTCMYLANRGIRAANVPFIKDIKLPDFFYNENRKPKPIIFGLIINPSHLIAIRENRLSNLDVAHKNSMDYIDPIAVREEIRAARKYFQEYNIKTIDTSNRSIEEVSAYILSEISK